MPAPNGQFQVPIQVLEKGTGAESNGSPNGSAAQVVSLTATRPGFTYVKDSTVAGGFIAVPPTTNTQLQSARVTFSNGVIAWAERGNGQWEYWDPGAGAILFSGSAGGEPLQQGGFFIDPGSALDIAVPDGTPIVDGHVTANAYETRALQFANATGMLYTDEAGDIVNSITELDATIRQQSGRFVTTSGVVINECGLALNDPGSRIFINSGDIGPGDDQIPANPAEWTSAKLQNHPSVFFRRTASVRAVGALNNNTEGYDIENPLPIQVGGTPNVFIAEAVRDPTYAIFFLIVDGSQLTAVFKIPDDSIGVRRPREIYQAIFGAGIYAGDAPQKRNPATPNGLPLVQNEPLYFYDLVEDNSDPQNIVNRFPTRGIFRIQSYITYARFVFAFDEDGNTPIYQPIQLQPPG